jgi:hypothetical protein
VSVIRRIAARLRRRPETNAAIVQTEAWPAVLLRPGSGWPQARDRARDGPNILIATAVGGLSALSLVESVLAVALTLRGARVRVLLCDGALPACLRAELDNVPASELGASRIAAHLCDGCRRTGHELLGRLGLDIEYMSSHISAEERSRAREIAAATAPQDIARFRLGPLAVGEHAYAGALRYYARGDLHGEPHANEVVRRYFESALLSAHAFRSVLQRTQPSVCVFNHGIYAPHGVFGEVCRDQALRVVNWNVAYRKRCFLFSHGDSYHHTFPDEPVTAWQDMPWSQEHEAAIDAYLRSRWHGTRDWIWFHEKPQESIDAIGAEVPVDFRKPVVGMLTNVVWDAQLHFRANAFPNMLDWVHETIGYFATRPDLQLVVRVHPAERRGTLPSRQPLVDEIRSRWPSLPTNVHVIPPESDVSTYALLQRCNAALIYGTKMGVELSGVGIPVIVAGDAWVRNKGVTMDARTRAEYLSLLGRLPLPSRLDELTTRRAKKYAYHFFFRRMIPIGIMAPADGWPPYRADVNSLHQLSEGADRGLDVICQGILQGCPFIFPAEQLPQRDLA